MCVIFLQTSFCFVSTHACMHALEQPHAHVEPRDVPVEINWPIPFRSSCPWLKWLPNEATQKRTRFHQYLNLSMIFLVIIPLESLLEFRSILFTVTVYCFRWELLSPDGSYFPLCNLL